MPQETAIDVKQAVMSARAYLLDLFETHGDVELEEVEPTPPNGGWRITFSFERPEHDPLGLWRIATPQQGKRVYKVVTVDASGNPQAVKMR